MIRILAIDIGYNGSNTAICLIDTIQEKINFGDIVLADKKNHFSHFCKQIHEKLPKYLIDIDYVAFESNMYSPILHNARWTLQTQTIQLMKALGVAQSIVYSKSTAKIYMVNPSQIDMFLRRQGLNRGKGRDDRKDMIKEYFEKRFHNRCESQDVMDAYTLAKFVEFRNNTNITDSLLKEQISLDKAIEKNMDLDEYIFIQKQANKRFYENAKNRLNKTAKKKKLD